MCGTIDDAFGGVGDFFGGIGDTFNNFLDSSIGQFMAPLAGMALGSMLLPGIGTALGAEIGAGMGGAIGGGLGSFGGTLGAGHNPFDTSSLMKTGLSGIGAYFGGPRIAEGISGLTAGGLSGLGSSAADIASTGLGEAGAWGYDPSGIGDISDAMTGSGLDPMTGLSAGGAGGGLSGLGRLFSGTTPYLLGGGLLSNFLGKDKQAGQQKSNLADYLAETTWTPQRASNYVSSVGSNSAGTIGSSAAKAKGTLAEQLAGSGRGGGSYGASANAINQNALNQIAAERNKAIATVNTPSNVSAAPFMAQTNATGETLTGLGGLLGNLATNNMTADLLARLGLLRI